jgi:hypothetical protein
MVASSSQREEISSSYSSLQKERKKESIKESITWFWVGSIPKGREISSSSSNFTKQARKKQTEKESQGWVCSNKDKTGSHIH